MSTDQPLFVIFAGANGSGKTTFAKKMLPELGVEEFVNPDIIAQEEPAGKTVLEQALNSGATALHKIGELISVRKTFAAETTLAKAYLKIIKQAQMSGYYVRMFYLFTGDPALNKKRVKHRVQQGGHDVPEDTVDKLNILSLKNLTDLYWNRCEEISIYNSMGSEFLLAGH